MTPTYHEVLQFKNRTESVLVTIIWISWLVLLLAALTYLILHFSLLALCGYALCWMVPALVIWCRL